MTKIVAVHVRMATSEDSNLEAYDNTKLTAINTCPTWGILRYKHHKVFPTNSRAMALEAGAAMHEVFAAVRLWQLCFHTLKDEPNEIREAFFKHHGIRLFGIVRFSQMATEIIKEESDQVNRDRFCLSALDSSGFYDDPRDRRRTRSNLQEAAITYINRYDYDRTDIWVEDKCDPTSRCGIEIAFEAVIEFTTEDYNIYKDETISKIKAYRFTGKFDGLHIRDGELVVGENKTASRLDDAWEQSFELSSQPTGYMLVAQIFTGIACHKATIYGIQIPLPKSLDLGGMTTVPVNREPYHFARWFDWFYHTVELSEKYSDPVKAPRYTHSCNRYFRPCSFIPFCYSDDDDQYNIIENEMVIEEWSPLTDKASD